MRAALVVLLLLLWPTTVPAQSLSSDDVSLLRQVNKLFDADQYARARDLLLERMARNLSEKDQAVPVPVLQALGNALYLTGDLDGAFDAYSQALEQEPNNPALCRNLGLTAYGLERWAESAPLLEKAYGLAQADAETVAETDLLFQAATAWALAEKYQNAARVLDKAWPLLKQPDLRWLKLNALARTKAGQHAKGIAPILDALDRTPCDEQLWLLLADAETMGERYGRAAAALEAVLRCNNESGQSKAGLLQRLAGLYAGTNLPFLAAKTLEPGASDAEALDRLGQLYARAGRLDPALDALERAQKAAYNAERAKRMALLCLNFGRHRQGADLLDRYLSARPGDHDARMLLAQARLTLKEPDKARQALKAIPADSRHRDTAEQLLRLLEE